MAESELSASDANALSGTTDSTLDFTWPTIAESPYYTTWYRMFALWKRILEQNPDALRVYKDGDLTFGVKAGKYFNGDSQVSYSEATGQSLTDNSTNHVYLTAAGTLTVSTTGFPSPYETAHIRLATIVTSGGTYDHTDITSYRDTSSFQVSRGAGKIKLTALVPGTWAMDGDCQNGGLAGLDNTGDLTETEAAAGYAQVYDASDTYYQLSGSSSGAGYTNDYQLLPDAEAENDAVYFGHSAGFCELGLDISTAAVYAADSITWEYYNGSAWSALGIVYDHTDSDDQDGDRPFQRDGAITFIPPSDWAATSVNSQSAYWIRARCTAAADITTIPTTNSKEHLLCSPADGIRSPVHCQITDIRLSDQASTLHTAGDVKFVVMNFTKGTHSGELTFAQDKRSDSWTGITMECDRGDVLGVLVTQEDGTNEVTGGFLEMDATVL